MLNNTYNPKVRRRGLRSEKKVKKAMRDAGCDEEEISNPIKKVAKHVVR